MNIAEILKNVPKGTKLYSPIMGGCELVDINNSRIVVKDKDDVKLSFHNNGTFLYEGECLLFPSKENRDWSTFKAIPKFKRGNFVVSNSGTIAILNGEKTDFGSDLIVCAIINDRIFTNCVNIKVERYATEEEKQKLLEAIDENGYVWDEEKLELRKKEHEFKPFDKVLVRDSEDEEWMIDLYSHTTKFEVGKECCIGGVWTICIPYKGNEHLLGTTNNPE